MSQKYIQNIRYFLLLILLFTITLITINTYIINYSSERIVKIKDLSGYKIGLVLGASVKPDGLPSDILADRLKTSQEAYLNGKISKIIVSGDNMKINYNEPDAMKKYLINLGVDKDDIYPDYAGFDTYDSMYRAKRIFGVKKMVIFTQKYHLYRSIYIANKIGIDSVGIESDKQKYLGIVRYRLREFLSRIKAFLEVEILKSETKYLKDKKIEIK